MNDWVVFKEVVGNMEADIIKGKLEAYDIPVQIIGEAYSKIVGLEHGDMSFVKILVPQEYLEQANKVFEEGA
ncbi:hypothetical protein J7J58_03840 [candidate division WOR-3 bacterium]|nr:hypothetical protein [candidate division WOR-3 bacterium]